MGSDWGVSVLSTLDSTTPGGARFVSEGDSDIGGPVFTTLCRVFGDLRLCLPLRLGSIVPVRIFNCKT